MKLSNVYCSNCFFTWLDEHGLSNEFGDETIQRIHYNLCPEHFESSIDSEEFHRVPEICILYEM